MNGTSFRKMSLVNSLKPKQIKIFTNFVILFNYFILLSMKIFRLMCKRATKWVFLKIHTFNLLILLFRSCWDGPSRWRTYKFHILFFHMRCIDLHWFVIFECIQIEPLLICACKMVIINLYFWVILIILLSKRFILIDWDISFHSNIWVFIFLVIFINRVVKLIVMKMRLKCLLCLGMVICAVILRGSSLWCIVRLLTILLINEN